MSVHHRVLAVVAAVATASFVSPRPAGAADQGWGPWQEAGSHTLAVALADGTTALVSVGGPRDATVYDQRRAPDGEPGPRSEVTSVTGVEDCRPVDAATALGNVAVALECRERTGLEDPPTTLVELVWTGDDGWVRHVQREGRLGSLDYSPGGQYVVFASNSSYGRAHHVTSYHADLGWRDLRRREAGSTGDDLVAAVSDAGDVVALRGAGFEDEPGYWFGGRLRIETYDAATDTWTRRVTRRYPDGGIDPSAIDVSGGRIVATVARFRSTGGLDGLDAKVVVLSGRPGHPRFWSSPRWDRRVLASSAAITRSGVGVTAWQTEHARGTARPWLATWAPDRAQPRWHDLAGRTTLTRAATYGRVLDLSVSAEGRAAVAHVRHRPGAGHATVAASSFRVGRHGGLRRPVDATWRRPVNSTVDVTASATSASLTLGRLAGYVPSARTHYTVCC